jgi:hypothetical protein
VENIVITTATGLPSIGGEMEYGHNRWNRHWRQGQHQNQACKEHRFTCFSSAQRIAAFAFLSPRERCAILAR